MSDKSSLLLIPILTITVVLSLSVSNVNAIVVNNTDFSIEVPNGWVYRENIVLNNNIILTPNEFADVLTMDDASLNDILPSGLLVLIAQDRSFPIKNAPLETYLKHVLRSVNTLALAPTSENATIGGERAIKVIVNWTDLARTSAKPNVTNAFETIGYYVMHDDQPYFLHYMANVKDFEKYIPQFEQIVKTFKFTK